MKTPVNALEAALTAVPVQLDDLYSIKELAAAHPKNLSEPAIRNQLRNRDENGLSPCVVRVGKKHLISKHRYETWLSMRWMAR